MNTADIISYISVVLGAAFALVGIVAGTTLARRVRTLARRADSVSDRIYVSERLADRLDGYEDNLSDKVNLVSKLSTYLAELNDEIKAEFTLQIAQVERLKQEADNAKNIAALNDTAMKAAQTLVAGQLDALLKRNKRGDRKWDILLAVGGAVVGIGATLIIQAITGSA